MVLLKQQKGSMSTSDFLQSPRVYNLQLRVIITHHKAVHAKCAAVSDAMQMLLALHT